MDDAKRSSLIKELGKVERKYQYLYGIARKLKNSALVSTLFAMESGTRILIRELESGREVSDKDVKEKINGIKKYETSLNAELATEKELDALADQVDKAWYVYSSSKDEVPSTLEPDLVMDFHRLGSDLKVLAANIRERDLRDAKVIKKRVDEFMAIAKRVEKALK